MKSVPLKYAMHYRVAMLDPPMIHDLADWSWQHLMQADCAAFVWTSDPSKIVSLEILMRRIGGFDLAGRAFAWARLKDMGRAKAFYEKRRVSDLENWHSSPSVGTRSTVADCWLFVRGDIRRQMPGSKAPMELIITEPLIGRTRPAQAWRRARQLFAGPHVSLFAPKRYPGWECWSPDLMEAA